MAGGKAGVVKAQEVGRIHGSGSAVVGEAVLSACIYRHRSSPARVIGAVDYSLSIDR